MVLYSKIIKIIGFVLVTAFFAQNANAIPVTQSQDFTLNNTAPYDSDHYRSNGDGLLSDSNTESLAMSFDRFDSSLGTLNSVSIGFSSSFDHYASAGASDAAPEYSSRRWYCHYNGPCHYHYYNSYSDTETVDVDTDANLDITLVDPSSATATSLDVNSLACTRSGTNSNSSCYVNDYDTGNDFSGLLDLSVFSLDAFIGSDPIDIVLTNFAQLSGTCTGVELYCYAYNDVYWRGNISVTYDYTAAASSVPEPSIVWLLGSGLIGLIGVTRRKQ